MPEEWDALRREVRDLAGRVARLEALAGLPQGAPGAAAERIDARPTAVRVGEPGSLVPLAGRALLGLAGAYLLRSLTENGNLPGKTGTAVGIAYAMAWLILAARTPGTRRIEAALHSLTAVLILSPLVWETTITRNVISTWTAAAMLIAFALFGLAVSWRKNLLVVATIVALAVLGTSGALLIATHDVAPFATVFLALAAAVETSACLDHWLSERWLTAAAADLAVLLATWLVTKPGGLPEVYAPIPHAWLIGALVALLAIYLCSTVIRTLWRGFPFTGFEIAQSAVAFAIVLDGGLRLSTTDPHLAPEIGALALVGGAGCYLVSFARLERRGTTGRNFYTYSTFGILLVLAGSRVLIAQSADYLWYALAVACGWAGRFFGRKTLAVHAAAFLLLALAVSGAGVRAGGLLLGTGPGAGVGHAALWLGGAAAVLAYAMSRRAHAAVRVALAAAAALVWAGILAGGLTAAYHQVFGAEASHAYCATLRTTVLAGLALVLAWASSRWKQAELAGLVYPAMILAGYRVLTDDLYVAKTALFLSLLVCGAALLALPRLRRAAD